MTSSSPFEGMGQVPKAIRDGGQLVFAQDVLDMVAMPQTMSTALRPDTEDREQMESYYDLARAVLDKYVLPDSFVERPDDPVTRRIEKTIENGDYWGMVYAFRETFAGTADAEPPRAIDEYLHTSVVNMRPVEHDPDCSKDCTIVTPVVDARAVIQYRWEVSQLADYLVQRFGLPAPDGKPCLTWRTWEWAQTRRMGPDEYHEHNKVWRHLTSSALIQRIETQGPTFSYQFNSYIAAAIAEAKLPRGEEEGQNMGVCLKIIRFMKNLRTFAMARAVSWRKDDPVIRRKVRAWWRSTGRQIPFTADDVG